MPISRLKSTLLASVLVLAGTANAATLLNEGFSGTLANLATAGWVITNQSSPAGSTSWFRPATTDVFAAQDGSTNYLAANYNSGVAGGTIANWLITPTFSTETAGLVNLWIRSAGDEGFTDTVKFGFSNGSSATSDFTLGSLVTVAGAWTEYTFAYAAAGAGSIARFAIEYTGSGDTLNQIGVDSITITTAAVPEPGTWAMFALGAAALVAVRRRSAR